jgi:hypothetical protein
VLRVVANARLLGQLVNAGQAHAGLAAIKQKQALDLLGQFVIDLPFAAYNVHSGRPWG